MEVMVSIGMLAVAALSILTVFIGGLKLMQRSNEMAAANDVAKSVLEAVKRDTDIHGLTAVPPGITKFDGRLPDAKDIAGPVPFPPDPYPLDWGPSESVDPTRPVGAGRPLRSTLM